MKPSILYMIFFTILTFSQKTFAQAWAPGKTQLLKGNYKGSESLLLKAVGQSKSKTDKAMSLKLLGIAQFMQEKKPLSEKSFRAALTLNPSLSISETEVADESVIPFFNQFKHSKPSPKKPLVQNKLPSSQQTMQSIQSKKTLLKIICNVPNAQVSLDGIAYGTAGSDMEVQPGTLVLEIFSPGYIKKAIKVQITARTANTVRVDLQKPAPKPKPAAVSAIPLPASGVKQQKGLSTKKKNAAKNSDLFGDDSDGDDFYGQAPAANRNQNPGALQSQSGSYVNPPPAPQQPNLPPNAYMNPPVQQGYPYAPQPYPQQQPYYMAPQPAYPNPYQQFPVQQPYYQQPPMQQVPMQQAPPSVYSPYSGYPPQGQVDPYMMAPPPEPAAPPLAAPAALEPPPIASESITGPPAMKPPKSFKKTSAKSGTSSKTTAKSCSTFIKLLPFGAGQFCQGSTFKGVLFAGSQIGALYFYKLNSDSSTSHSTSLAEYQSQRSTDRETIDASEEEAFDQETARVEEDGNAAISKANQNANMSLMLFGGAWAAGVADAVFFAPKPKKSAKKMRLAILPPKAFHPQTTLALLNPVSLIYDENFDWYIGTGQSIALREDKLVHSINVGLTWEL